MDRTNSMGLWRYASEFSEAGRIVLENSDGTVPPQPAYYLYCHAIELALKAFLRGSGSTLTDLKGSGHDIRKLLKKAFRAGFHDRCLLEPGMISAIELVSPTYRDKEFEYIKTGSRVIPKLEKIE